MIGILLATAAMTMFAANIMLTKFGSARLPLNAGFLVTVASNIVFATFLLCIELVVRKTPLAWNGTSVLLFALAGIFATYLGRWFMFESIVRLGPAKASAFQVSSPLFAFVLSLLFLGERLGIIALAGMVVAAAGLLVLSLFDARAASSKRPAGQQGWKAWLRAGWALGLASSAAYAVGNVLRGGAVREWNEPIAGALIGAVVGILLHFAVGSDHANVLRGFRTASRRGIVLFALGGVLNISAQMCVIAAMKYAPVSIVALITLCTPLLVFPMSYLMLKNEERINAGTVGGAVVTLAGIAMIIVH